MTRLAPGTFSREVRGGASVAPDRRERDSKLPSSRVRRSIPQVPGGRFDPALSFAMSTPRGQSFQPAPADTHRTINSVTNRRSGYRQSLLFMACGALPTVCVAILSEAR